MFMNPKINTLPPARLDLDTWWRRVLRHPLARMITASLAMFLPLALTFALMEALLPKNMGLAWPNLVAALVCALGYWIYVNRVERRAVSELSGPGAMAEWTRGAGLGVLAALLTLVPLYVLGVYRIEGSGDGFAVPSAP